MSRRAAEVCAILRAGAFFGLAMPFTAFAAEGVSQTSTTLSVSVHDSAGWENLHYRRLAPNQVSFTPAGVRIKVRSSASPLIYPLAAPRRVSKVRVRLQMSGSLVTPPYGEKWDEDSRFRLGLVVSGEKRLSVWAKAAAPAWVKRLFSLAPPGGGIDRIVFLMMGRSPAKVGATRRHPSSELIEERLAWTVDKADGDLKLEAVVDPPLAVSALWISADGDDTGSAYELLVESIELE